MKIGGLGNSLLVWLLVSGGLHAAVLWGAGGWGDFSGEGTGYIEVALAPSPLTEGDGRKPTGAAPAGAEPARPRPPAGGAARTVPEMPVKTPRATVAEATLAPPPSESSAMAVGTSAEVAFSGSGAAVPAATEDSAGAGDGAAGAVGGVATGQAIGGKGGSGPAGEGGGRSVRTPPRCIEMRQPSYPQDARRRRWEGEVKLRLHVASDGSVREVRVAESSGYDLLDRAARDAAGRWKFQPARLGPVPVEDDAVFVTVGFELDRN